MHTSEWFSVLELPVDANKKTHLSGLQLFTALVTRSSMPLMYGVVLHLYRLYPTDPIQQVVSSMVLATITVSQSGVSL
jgi:hypothetical protein